MGLEQIPHNFLTGRLEDLVRWARQRSMFPATFGLACCAIELMAVGGAHYDLARFGMEIFRASPRQADLMIVAAGLRPDGRPEVGDLDGRLRQHRRHVQQLRAGAGR
jgi:NADH:ubiquinone oxidoreductase subunit B-like Fe-S oxidoreductase